MLGQHCSTQRRYNIQRAAQLIQSFKQVAVDQASEQYCGFESKSYLKQLIASLAPEVRKAGHSLVMACEEDIRLTSYPGALAQVLTNLVSNAIAHAYDRGTAGTIALTAVPDGANVALTVSDNGRGIEPENMSRIYDPFFTTKRGAGGSGLGLHIVFNIVTETLNGHIDCRFLLDDALPAIRKAPPEAIVVADGTSCRHQIKDGTGHEAIHVARLLAASLAAAKETMEAALQKEIART